jgi:hypothetical protein
VMQALIALLASTGQRKSEALVPDGEQWDRSRASRSQITWRIKGVFVADPSEQQLRGLDASCFMLWTPGRSKQDFAGVHWGAKPIVIRFHPTKVLNAPRLIAQMELRHMVRGTMRIDTPLFSVQPVANKPLKFAHVEQLLRPLLIAAGACQEVDAKLYSWHSFRIFLACALKAAKVPDADIQVILRWKSVASLHAYARLTVEAQEEILEAGLAAGLKIDVRQAANLPELDDYYLAQALDEMVEQVDKMV